MDLKLYNTLTRGKETFAPLHPPDVGIYTCGPTVYHSAHIGNLRSYVFPDVLKKTLRLLGFRVTHVINITDVGHLTSDADTGEDKMERAARLEHRSAWDIAKDYEAEFRRDLARLNIAEPDHWPRATAHILDQIELIRMLEAQGYTYRTADGVYFDTARFPRYGELARLKVDSLREGARIEMGDKRHKTDFALWKLSPPGQQRQMEWDSPWGRGFPGWHIECSAMSRRYLGDTFDIHTGGSDHIPVHHTNEIAQSECATGLPFVRYWLHGEHLVLPKEDGGAGEGEFKRMGKSEGNLITLQTLIDAGYDPMAFRYLCLTSHYRSYLNFSEAALKGADTALMGLRKQLRDLGVGQPQPPRPIPPVPERGLPLEIAEKLCDDLNTPQVLGILWTAIKRSDLSIFEIQEAVDYADRVLSLGLFDYSGLGGQVRDYTQSQQNVSIVSSMRHDGIPEDIIDLVEQRNRAREKRIYTESDRLRKELEERGWIMRDLKGGGFELSRK